MRPESIKMLIERLINMTFSTCIQKTWTWACDHLKTSNSSEDNFKKTRKQNEVDTQAYDTVMWYWSVDTLFWQLSIAHNMNVLYQAAGSHTS